MADTLEEIRKRCNEYHSSRVTIIEQNRLRDHAGDDIAYLLETIDKLKSCNCGMPIPPDKDDNGPCPGLQCEEISELRKQLKQHKKELEKAKAESALNLWALELTCAHSINVHGAPWHMPEYCIEKAKEMKA